MTEALQRLKMFIRDHAPTLLEGEVLEVKQSTIQVKVNFESKELIFSDAKLICNNEISFSPEVGSKVLVGFINKKWNSPIVLGSISSYNKDKVSILDSISADKTSGKVMIKNNGVDLGDIISKILEALIKLGTNLTSYFPPIPNTLIADITPLIVKNSSIFDGNIGFDVEELKKKTVETYSKLKDKEEFKRKE